MPKFLSRKAITAPTLQERVLQANDLTAGALSVFSKSADDLEIAGHLKQEIAVELDEQATALRYEAEELEGQASVIDSAADDDFAAADRIRSFLG